MFRSTRVNVEESIAFAHPFAGPNDCRGVAKEILNNKTAKMYLPDGEKTSFLLKAVYCGSEEFQSQPESIELRDEIMKPRNLLVFQRNLWIPENYGAGVFVVYDEKGVGTSEELDVGDLEKSLKGGKKLKNGIRFSEDGKTGFLTLPKSPNSLAEKINLFYSKNMESEIDSGKKR